MSLLNYPGVSVPVVEADQFSDCRATTLMGRLAVRSEPRIVIPAGPSVSCYAFKAGMETKPLADLPVHDRTLSIGAVTSSWWFQSGQTTYEIDPGERFQTPWTADCG